MRSAAHLTRGGWRYLTLVPSVIAAQVSLGGRGSTLRTAPLRGASVLQALGLFSLPPLWRLLWLIELANQRIQRALSLSSTVSLDNANCCVPCAPL